MKIKSYIQTVILFFVLQVLINIAWGQLLRDPTIDLGRILGIVVFHLPFSALGAAVLMQTGLGPTKMGLLSLAFGFLNELMALAGGKPSDYMGGILQLNFSRPVLFSLFSSLTYWFAEWSVPTYAIQFHVTKLFQEIQAKPDRQPWHKQWVVWAGILSFIGIVIISYLDHFA